MAEHYWVNKAFRSEGTSRGAPWRNLPSSLSLRLVASLLLVVSLSLAGWNSLLQRQAKQPRSDTAVLDLFPDAATQRGDPPQPQAAPPSSDGFLVLVLHPPPDPIDNYPRHDVEILKGRAGGIRWQEHDVPRREYGTFNIGLSRDFLAGGPFTVRLYGVERSGHRELLASYPVSAGATAKGAAR